VPSRRTTISCRCFARIALRVGLILGPALVSAAPRTGQLLSSRPTWLSWLPPSGGSARPAASFRLKAEATQSTTAPPVLPHTVLWTVPSAAPPAGAPIVAGASLIVPLRTGVITAHSLADGAVRWTVPLTAAKPLAADEQRVYVADGEMLHALSAADGKVAWRVVAGRPMTAPPLAHAGWVLVAAAGDLIAIRADDGVVLWRKTLGPIEFQPALDGDLLVVSMVDGRLIALNLKDGSERWTMDLHSSPSEPFAIGERVYVGTQDRTFYVLYASSGRIEDHRPIGAQLRGRVAVDDDRVYLTGLDNMLRVVRRRGGARIWQKSLIYRPAAGPVLFGDTVVVPGYVETPLPVFAVDTGTQAGALGFDAPLVALPVFTTLPDGRLGIVGITGGLENKWTISLRTPSLVRPIALQPLTVLPGEALPLPQPRRW
jgi:outer membrane protein assembly factor BamB